MSANAKKKGLPTLAGRTISEAFIYLGGAYMGQDDRSLELKFADGSMFIFEIRAREIILEGDAVYYDAGDPKTVKEEAAQRHVLRKL